MNKRFLTVSIVVVLALTGCGGSSKHGSTGTGTNAAPTRATFIAQLNSLCVRANNAYAAAPNTQGKVAVIARYVRLFAALQAPSQLKSLYARYVAVLGQELVQLRKGSINGLYNLAHNQARPLVTKIGATQCVTSS